MNVGDLPRLLRHVGLRRARQLAASSSSPAASAASRCHFDGRALGLGHAEFDLARVRKALELMAQHLEEEGDDCGGRNLGEEARRVVSMLEL